MSEVSLSRNAKINAKWEEFTPKKIDGKMQYTIADIARVFGVSHAIIGQILDDKGRCNENLRRKVKQFASEVQLTKYCEKTDHIHIHERLSTRGYVSDEQRYEHMITLRENGYTNAQISKYTGYTVPTVIKLIGCQPKEYTEASMKRAGDFHRRICNDRKSLSAAFRQKKVDAANAQVESYNAAVDELARLDEAVAMAKMKYIQQKSTVEKMRGALSSCAEYATVPIKPMPDAEQNGENRPN